MSNDSTDKTDSTANKNPQERARQALRSGDYALAARAIGRGEYSIAELMEDLRIYRAELEMQNEELHLSRQETNHALESFSTLFTHLPLPALVIDGKGLITQANEMARHLFGLSSNSPGRAVLHRLVSPEHRDVLIGALVEGKRLGHAHRKAMPFQTGLDQPFLGDLWLRRLPSDTAEPSLVAMVVGQQ